VVRRQGGHAKAFVVRKQEDQGAVMGDQVALKLKEGAGVQTPSQAIIGRGQ